MGLSDTIWSLLCWQETDKLTYKRLEWDGDIFGNWGDIVLTVSNLVEDPEHVVESAWYSPITATGKTSGERSQFFIIYIMIEMLRFIKVLLFKAWIPLLVMWRSADLSSQVAITLLLLLLPTKMKLDLKHPIIGYGKHNPVFQNDGTRWCVEKSIDILACW